jgi:hypothetical protein
MRNKRYVYNNSQQVLQRMTELQLLLSHTH